MPQRHRVHREKNKLFKNILCSQRKNSHPNSAEGPVLRVKFVDIFLNA